jgi:hypothetical protein
MEGFGPMAEVIVKLRPWELAGLMAEVIVKSKPLRLAGPR